MVDITDKVFSDIRRYTVEYEAPYNPNLQTTFYNYNEMLGFVSEKLRGNYKIKRIYEESFKGN